MFNLVNLKKVRQSLIIVAKVIGCVAAVVTSVFSIIGHFNGQKSPTTNDASCWGQYNGPPVSNNNIQQQSQYNNNTDISPIDNFINLLNKLSERVKRNNTQYVPNGPTHYQCKNGNEFTLHQPILSHNQCMNLRRVCDQNPYYNNYAYNNLYASQQSYPFNYGYYNYFGGNNMSTCFYEDYPLINDGMGHCNVNMGDPTSAARYLFMNESNNNAYNNITIEQQIQYAVSQIPEPQKPYILSNDINASFSNRDKYGRFILPKFFNSNDVIHVNYIKYMNDVNNCINGILTTRNIPLNNNMYARANVPDVNGWMLETNPTGIPARQLRNINTGKTYPVPNDFMIPSELSLSMVATLYGEYFQSTQINVSAYDCGFLGNENKNYQEMLNRTPQIYKDSCINLGKQFQDCQFGDSLKTGYFGPLCDKDSFGYRLQQEYTRGPENGTSALYDERLFARERADMYRDYNNTHADIAKIFDDYDTWGSNYINESPYQSMFLPNNSMIPDYRKQNPFGDVWSDPNFRMDDLYYKNVNPMCRAMYENHWQQNGVTNYSNWDDGTNNNVWTNMRFDNNNNPYYGNAQIFGGPTDTAYQNMCQQVSSNPAMVNNFMNQNNNPYSGIKFMSPELQNINPCVTPMNGIAHDMYIDKNNSQFFYSDKQMEEFQMGNYNTTPDNRYNQINNNNFQNLDNIMNNKVCDFTDTGERWQNGKFVVNNSTGVKYWIADGVTFEQLGNIDNLVVTQPNYVKRAESINGGGDYATYNSQYDNTNPWVRNTAANQNGVTWMGTQSPLKSFVNGEIVFDPHTHKPYQLANGVKLKDLPTGTSGSYDLICGLCSHMMRKIEQNDPIVSQEMLSKAQDPTTNMNNKEIAVSVKEVDDFFGNKIKVKNNSKETKVESKFDENGREVIRTDKFGNVLFKNMKGEEFIDYKGGDVESVVCEAPLLSAEQLFNQAMKNNSFYGNAPKEQ